MIILKYIALQIAYMINYFLLFHNDDGHILLYS